MGRIDAADPLLSTTKVNWMWLSDVTVFVTRTICIASTQHHGITIDSHPELCTRLP